MNNNLKFDFDKPLVEINSTKESDTCVVQCGHCETRYAVPRENIPNSTTPKFHCFSCDNIFEAKPNDIVSAPVASVGSGPTRSFTTGSPVTENPPSLTSTSEKETPAFGFSSSLKVTSKVPLEVARTKKEENFNSKKVNFANAHKETDLSVRKIDSEAPRKSFVFTDFQKTVGKDANKSQGEKPNKYSWKLDDKENKSLLPSFPVKENLSKFYNFCGDVKKVNFKLPELSYPKIKINKPLIATKVDLKSGLKQVGFSSKILLVITPILSALLLLYLLTSIILSSPDRFSDYFGFATDSTKNYPAPGLGVRDLSLKLVKLDNGEELQLFSGEFYNNSEQEVSNPVIEGILFDPNGSILARSFHTFDLDISKVKYQSLDRETLTELPKLKEKDKFILKPNEKQNFSFALLADAKVKPSYFTGRIYSIS